MKFVAAGMNPMDMKRGIDKAVAATVEELRKISKPCTTNKEISKVGAISAKKHLGSDVFNPGNSLCQASLVGVLNKRRIYHESLKCF
jgi:hypothetical protein